MIIGIDPGQKGALVCLTEQREVIHCWRGDELRVKGDTEMNDRLALDALETCVKTNGGVELVVLEYYHPLCFHKLRLIRTLYPTQFATVSG